MSGQGGPQISPRGPISGKEDPVSGHGAPCQARQGGPRSSQVCLSKQGPILGHGLPLWAEGAISGRGPGLRPMRTQIRPSGLISSIEGFVSCNLASFWAKGTPDQAKGPYFRQLGPLVRPRGPLSRQGAPDQPKGPHFRQRGPRVRPRGSLSGQARGSQIRPSGPISGKQGPISGHRFPL